jgi:hypothetical protein
MLMTVEDGADLDNSTDGFVIPLIELGISNPL